MAANGKITEEKAYRRRRERNYKRTFYGGTQNCSGDGPKMQLSEFAGANVSSDLIPSALTFR